MKKVLIVDDDKNVLELVRDLLKDHDIKDVITASTTREALVTFVRTPDITTIISDLNIGKERGGDQLHRSLLPLLKVRGVKFIAMSGDFTEAARNYFNTHKVTCLEKTKLVSTLPQAMKLTQAESSF